LTILSINAQRCSVALATALMFPAISFAANTTLEIKVDSETYVSGSRVVELEDGVTKTVVFERTGSVKYDKRCAFFGLIGPDGDVPTTVKVDVTTKRLEGGRVLARADLKASGAGEAREALVSANGDRAVCPSVTGTTSEASANLRVGEPQTVFNSWDDRKEHSIKVTLTAQ